MLSRRIGFIGLGDMGQPMAKNLVKKGFQVTVYDIRREPADELRSLGATVAESPGEVAAASDVVISVVRDIPQTQEVIFGKAGVWEALRDGATIIISSTVAPSYCQELYTKAKERGVRVIDAAVSGGHQASEAGTLTFMVGGDADVVTQCQPVLEAMGKNIFHLGSIGMGQAFKLVNNLILAGCMAGSSEGVTLGLKAGLDLKTMLEVVKVSTGNSWVIQNWDFLAKLAEAVGVELMLKDLRLAMEMAENVGVPTPLTQVISQMDWSKFFPVASDR